MLIAAAALSMLAFGMEIYVAPTGSDAASGTSAKPYRTVARALDAAKGTPATIHVRGGVYRLTAPLKIGAENSHLVIEAIDGERPVLSGGIALNGWHRDGDRWSTTVPGSSNVNQLFVNGVRYRRPRLPETGYFSIVDIVAASDREQKSDHSLRFKPGDIEPDWHDLSAIDVIVFESWTITRLPLSSVNASEHLIEFASSTSGASWAMVKPGGRYLIENVKEALHRPGEFYFDRATRQVTVIPEPGVDLDRAQVEVPVLDRVIEVSGTTAKPVEDVRLIGMSFRETVWTMAPTGRKGQQAEADLGGAVLVQNARKVSFEKCEISHVGGYGFEVGDDAQDTSFMDGIVTDMAAGGIKIGVMKPRADESTVSRRTTIRNNLIAGGGRVHPAGVGIWIGQSPYNTVDSNEIANFYYSGVSVGWTWGYGSSNAHHNLIEGNHIHHIGQGVLSDMGGIYHLGVAPGTILRGNRIHDVTSFDYGGWGLYTDEGSSDVLMEDNIVYRCNRESFYQHFGKDNIVRRNILAFAGESQLARSIDDHRSFSLDGNLVVWTGTPLLEGNWDGDDSSVAMDRNLYWRIDGQPVTFGELSLVDWQKRGRDLHSIVADPQFVDPSRDDFRLKPGSPALALGFTAMDPKGNVWPTRWTMPPPSWPVRLP